MMNEQRDFKTNLNLESSSFCDQNHIRASNVRVKIYGFVGYYYYTKILPDVSQCWRYDCNISSHVRK